MRELKREIDEFNDNDSNVLNAALLYQGGAYNNCAPRGRRLHVMRRLNWFMVVTAFAASRVYAQDLTGDWQGSLNAGPQELRIILNITRTDSGEWRATMLSIDQSPDR